MSEDLNRQEEDLYEDEESTPTDGGESEETSDEDSEETDETQKDSKIAELEKTVADLKKGFDKAFSEQGRKESKEESKEEKGQETKPAQSYDDEIVTEVLLTKYPEAEHVMDELKETAEMKGKSILKLYRDSKYFQGEAKAAAEAKKSDEEAKSKISKPSGQVASDSKKDISKVKPEDVSELTPSEKSKWLKMQAEKERSSDD